MPFLPVGLEHGAYGLIICCASFWTIKGYTSKMKANAEHIEVRNKERKLGFEMLDQTLPETTLVLQIYCLTILFEFFCFMQPKIYLIM